MHSSSQFAPSGGLWSWLPSLWWTVSWRTLFALNSRAQRALVPVPDQPVRDAQGEGDGGQPEHLRRPDLVQVENDELAGDREQRDEEHYFSLDDALLALDHVLQGVIELERDEQRHDLAEHVLEHLLVEGVQDAGQHADDDGRGEAIERDENDEADDERQGHGDRALEALVIRHHRPLRFQL